MEGTWYQIILVLILICLSELCKAIQDKLQFHFDVSIFSKFNSNWWNPKKSHRNKWEWSDKKWIQFILVRWLVWITDAWHFFGMIRYVLVILILFVLGVKWWIVIMGYILGRTTFHLFFMKLFNK